MWHLLLVLSMTVFCSQALFFGGGGGCGCRPQQCNCAPPVQNFCPPPPCGARNYPSFTSNSYRPPPPPPPQFYAQPHPVPIQTGYQTSYQQSPLMSSYNAPSDNPLPTKIQVASAKETSSTSDIFGDTVIQKSKTLSSIKNDLDDDNALTNFESSLQAYKSMSRNGVRRAQGTKIEQPEKCSSPRLYEIMQRAMTSNVSVSKLRISQGAKKEFGYNFDVICSQSDFSYLISSNIYCRVEIDGQTCLAYEN